MLHDLRQLFEAYPLDFYSIFFLLLPICFSVYRQEFLVPVLTATAVYFSVRFLEECFFLYYALLVRNNHNLIKGSVIIDIVIIGESFYLGFKNNILAKNVTLVLTSIAFVTAILNYASSGPPSVNKTVLRLLMIILALLYFNNILSENRIRKVLHHSMFWVSSGFLFYGMGTIMTSIFSDYLVITPKDTYDVFSDMNQWLSMLFSILVSIGLWVSKFDEENYIQPV